MNRCAYGSGTGSATTDGAGVYSFHQAFAAASGALGHLGRLLPFDTNGNGTIDPDEGELLLMGGTSITDGSANPSTMRLVNFEGHALYRDATVFLDRNANGQLDPGEVSTRTDADGFYTSTIITIP